MNPTTNEYDTFEAREAAFNAAVGCLIPARYKGPNRFWEDFRKVTQGEIPIPAEMPAYITSNPRDCLAFGSVRQVLAAALMSGRITRPMHARGTDGPIEEVIERFSLTKAVLQPIRTLSGGETVRLALAKASLATAYSNRLVIASPFCWLSRSHLPLLESVFADFDTAGKPVTLFSMRGEASREPMDTGSLEQAAIGTLPFDLEIRNFHIMLGTPINAITAEPAVARVHDFQDTLASPCLMIGDNGQGKSLVAKALCRAVGFSGQGAIGSSRGNGQARLLFQEVIAQTLLRPMDQLARFAGSSGDLTPNHLFSELASAYAALATHPDEGPLRPVQAEDATLLAIKLMLIAARLARRPSALFLDEPDWGLSREAAVAMVLAVVRKAHELGVAVILISHKPWWRPMARAMLHISKQPGSHPTEAFSITINPRQET
jgi:ABC-type nitrate/sulfonate/bicarbonate transport system ATPase subunit